ATAVAVGDAAKGAEVVVVTIPLKAIPGLPDDVLAGAAEGAVVVDTNNYYPRERDGRIGEIEDGGITESRWVSNHLGHDVVKVFNGTYAQDILDRHRPAGDPERIAVPVAGDDPAAKKEAADLLDALGWDAVDVGTLAESWRVEPESPVYVKPYVGEAPEGLSPAEWFGWAQEAPGVTVPADRVRHLADSAVRGPAGGVVPEGLAFPETR
ncbi:NADPH-dependent F420 reductase, partial [Streptomyces niveiscabiei]|uniref:NADPH-dependent F420 reductase n=1 Tax=Streptomyces niveiscabiei TaxID=164115 RepID=UPI000AD932E1